MLVHWRRVITKRFDFGRQFTFLTKIILMVMRKQVVKLMVFYEIKKIRWIL
jgi:hypothetical protein